MIHIIKTKEKGYAILFAVVIISVISVIAFGLSSSTYKQLILSSLASDSQVAFFQADTGSECGLYADMVEHLNEASISPWLCGVTVNQDNTTFMIDETSTGIPGYTLTPINPGTAPCFDIVVTNDTVSAPPVTTMRARGYNNCDKNNMRTVEREIQITY